MEELKKFQSSTVDAIARRRSVEDQDIASELIGRVQELQIENNCTNDSREFQDASSRAAEKGRLTFGTHMVYRETFLQIQMRHHQRHILKK